GPQHHNTKSMQRLVPLFQRSGVKAVFSGHEHNFQHSHADGIDYFITGAAGRLRRSVPDQFAEAHTVTWATECHFLLVDVSGDKMTVRALGEVDAPDQVASELVRFDPEGQRH